LEEVAQLVPRLAAAEAVRAQADDRSRQVPGEDVGRDLHVITGGDQGPLRLLQLPVYVRLLRILSRVQPVTAVGDERVAVESLVRGDAPDVGSDTVIALKDLLSFQDAVHDAARAEELRLQFRLLLLAGPEQVHPFE